MPVAKDLRKGDFQVIDEGQASILTQGFVQDTAKRWSPGQWRGHYVRIRGGLNDCATGVIEDNSESRLMLEHELPVVPDAPDESSYEILTLQVDPSAIILERLQRLETRVEESNIILRQIREGIGFLVERPLAEIYPET